MVIPSFSFQFNPWAGVVNKPSQFSWELQRFYGQLLVGVNTTGEKRDWDTLILQDQTDMFEQ